MLFWVKKVLGFALMPFTLLVVLMVVGLWLMRSAKRARLGRILLIGSLATLIVLSNKYVAKALLRPLETKYPAQPELIVGQPLPSALAECQYIYVLGGGHGSSPNMSATNLLSSPSLSRITEAVRLLRVLPNARLIVSGPGSPGEETHAAVLGRAARELGIAADRISYIDQARDTEDEINEVKKIVGEKSIIVVTSAWHMPRAMGLCRGARVKAVAAPTDFQTHADDSFYFTNAFWDVGALGNSTRAVSERIGYLWIWLRGKT